MQDTRLGKAPIAQILVDLLAGHNVSTTVLQSYQHVLNLTFYRHRVGTPTISSSLKTHLQQLHISQISNACLTFHSTGSSIPPTEVVLVEIFLEVATLHLHPHLSFPTHKTNVIVLRALQGPSIFTDTSASMHI